MNHPEHLFKGSAFNCETCNLPLYLHRNRNRPEHAPQGDPCTFCGLPARDHRVRQRVRGRKAKPTYHRLDCAIKSRGKSGIRHDTRLFLGIDGEGQGKEDHKYVTLATKSEDGSFQDYIHNPDGLSTEQCLEFILDLPDKTKIFAFAFQYDLTKILKDLPDETLYYLLRPELRRRSKETEHFGPRPVKWNGYLLNVQGTKFVIIHLETGRSKKIWDIWKFYQSRFTKALKLWKVGDPAVVAEIERMKDLRSEFDKKTFDEVLEYCLSECMHLAQLARRLVDAHEAAGLKLKNFFGAGSTAGAILQKLEIDKKIREIPDAMKEPAYMAFFGGRFENSVIGTVPGTVYNHDIASAYPYQLCFLPCLEHGTWTHTRDRKLLSRFKTALVRYALPEVQSEQSWGPFPFREANGSISFPASSGGGWVWLEEYLAGERLFKNVRFIEAWGLFSQCSCKPFGEIPFYYRERVKLGKEGPGIVLKLGTNSVYGKLAQSVGRAMFNSWIWAGLVTSGCRAQILDLMALHQDLSNLLMIATDGVYTREPLGLPLPRWTDTEDCKDAEGKIKSPLGGWESKRYDKGLFAARPGIYFPIDADSESIDAIRARGLGKGVLLDNMAAIMRAWDNRDSDTQTFVLKEMTRFCGAKSSISYSPKRDVFTRSDKYGQWVNRPTVMSFNPKPKRERIRSDGTLEMRVMPQNLMSVPYKKAFKSREADELGILEMLVEEQPDLGFEKNYEILRF